MAFFRSIRSFWKALGPGLITGASDNDPSGIASYSIAGARTGFGLLWTLPFIIPFMVAIQEMSARIGALSACGLTGNIKRHYPTWILATVSGGIIGANVLNIGADIAGMTSAAQLLFPGLPTMLTATAFTLAIVGMIIWLRYATIVAIFKWLALSLLAYVGAFAIVRGDAYDMLVHTLLPALAWDRETVLVFFAILGTTISPYLYFWQSSEEAEEVREKNTRIRVCKFRPLSDNRLSIIELDTAIGMSFSNIVAYFIVALTGATLYSAGVRDVDSVAQIAEALRPLAGEYAYILFTLGLISSGFLAIPVLAGSAAYVLAEIFGWERSLDKPFSRARAFYIVLALSAFIGLIVPLGGISPVQALFYTAVLHAIVSPPLILLITHMASNKAIVGDHVSSPTIRGLALGTAWVMTITGILLIIPGIW
ncbi:MAG: divalent metal cation transporter [Candidatus Paceibacterota bacterium]|nr:MAG: divalent metal cation transporter [Candidatus Paceibacterota bacterium]